MLPGAAGHLIWLSHFEILGFFVCFFILFLVRGSDSDGKWETPPNWPSPFSSSPALQVGVEGGCMLYCQPWMIQCCAHCYLCRVQCIASCYMWKMQCKAALWEGGGPTLPFHLIIGALSVRPPCVDVHAHVADVSSEQKMGPGDLQWSLRSSSWDRPVQFGDLLYCIWRIQRIVLSCMKMTVMSSVTSQFAEKTVM